FLFALVTWQVAARGPLYRWDRALDAGALRAAARATSLTPFAQVLADLGELTVALPVPACALAYAAWRRRRPGRRRRWSPGAAGLVWRGDRWPLGVVASWSRAGVLLAVVAGVTRWWGSPG